MGQQVLWRWQSAARVHNCLVAGRQILDDDMRGVEVCLLGSSARRACAMHPVLLHQLVVVELCCSATACLSVQVVVLL
jgi:hypothetical protein